MQSSMGRTTQKENPNQQCISFLFYIFYYYYLILWVNIQLYVHIFIFFQITIYSDKSLLTYPVQENLCTNDQGYIPFVVIQVLSIPCSRHTTGLLKRVTQRVPLVNRNCLPSAAPEFTSEFCEVRVDQSLVISLGFGILVLQKFWSRYLHFRKYK
jgi:hypothetical protein